jgi:S1-C subfamily serine protease
MSPIRRAGTAALIGLAAMAGEPAFALNAEQVYAKASASVWRVRTYDADNLPLSQGSAVIVGPEAAATNCHVLAKAKRVSLQREKESFDATLEFWDVKRDVCQLKAPGLKAAPVVLGDSAKITVGQNVFAIGNPKGLELTMSAGLVSSLRRNPTGQLVLIQTSAAISGGSSGGGLFDDQARLIGLTTLGSVSGDAQNLNFAIPSEWVRELPQRHAQAKTSAQTASSSSDAAANGAAGGSPAAASPAAATQDYALNADGFARIDDIARLPFATERMREGYRAFLARPLPRAFVISEGGSWQIASGLQPATPVGPASPAESAKRECVRARTGRCFVYAIDDRVVWRADAALR